jgi:predicted nucleic acid-binding protein
VRSVNVAQSERHANDAFHIVESAKNGGRHFITNDKRLLKKSPQIRSELLIRILTPSEFIADYFSATKSNEVVLTPNGFDHDLRVDPVSEPFH